MNAPALGSLLALFVTFSTFATPGGAQQPTRVDQGGDVTVGSEAERYLRALQLAGRARPTSWTIRHIGVPHDGARLVNGVHPWSARFTSDSAPRRAQIRLLRPDAKIYYNSTFPVTTADGPTWAGRGVTGELKLGVVMDVGRVHLQLAPHLFLAENAPFALAPNGLVGRRAFADARFPSTIDAPQRFGSRSYGRIDGGNSTLSLRLPGVALGVSTAAQAWGPGREYPLVLSGNSGGFPHGFIGTSTPLNLGIFSLHTRIVAGTLKQSGFSPVDTGNTKRWASAGVVTIIPRGLRGLEFGFTRFVQAKATGNIPTPTEAGRVFQRAAPDNVGNLASENQVASMFFRWAFPGKGFELYGEYSKEDYTIDFRRLLQYPDDLRAYAFGLQRVLQNKPQQVDLLRFELVNAELSSSNRGERGDLETRTLYQPFPPYLHGEVRQGHTNNGLFLGSAQAYGGAAWRLGFDRYHPKGRSSFIIERTLRMDWLPVLNLADRGVRPDVIWAIGAEALRFKGRRELAATVQTGINLNRNIRPNYDVLNLRTTFSVRGW